ncbi:MAG: lysylphosphatidylglycerol synthase transmembrane domain-containing protein [bacterium]|nr:lysylphosphatidylglycerol synthase transmembrane domain-containing protein [bacterium]
MKKIDSRFLFNLISIIITAIILFFLAIKLSGDFSKIDLKLIHFSYPLLIISFFFVPIWFSLLSLAYQFILSGMGAKISLLNSMRIIGISTFGRYIPGKIWFTVGRAVLAERVGVSKKNSFTAVLIETFYLILTGLTFFVFSYKYITGKSAYFLLLFPASFAAVSLVKPGVFTFLMNIFLRKMKKDTIEMNMSIKDAFVLNGIYILMWLGFGLQFLFLIKSLGFSANSVFLISVYPVAWVLGFIVIFIPSGIGIREGVMVFLLSHFMDGGTALAISILSRIQMTLSELLFLFTLIKSNVLWRKK